MEEEKRNVVDLDEVLISPATLHVYREFADRIALALVRAGVDPMSIPIEQGRIEADGGLTVFVAIKGIGGFHLLVHGLHRARCHLRRGRDDRPTSTTRRGRTGRRRA